MLNNKTMLKSEATLTFLKGILEPNKSWYLAVLLIFYVFSSTSEANEVTCNINVARDNHNITETSSPFEKTATQELTQNLKDSILSAFQAQSSFEEATLI